MQNYNKFDKIENVSFIKELAIGFSKKNKKIPSRFHYDLNGSKYFEKIIKLKEYYLARTEKKILKQLSLEMKNIFIDKTHNIMSETVTKYSVSVFLQVI